MKHRACADPFIDLFLCTRCGHRIALPRMLPRPALRWLKQALRQAKVMQAAGDKHWFEVPMPAQHVPYVMSLLHQAGYATLTPEGSAILLARVHTPRPRHQ